MSATMVAPTPEDQTPPAPSDPGPSKVWYWVSAAVVLVSVLGAVAIWLVGRYQVESKVEGYARFLAPGSAELRFKRGGLYTLYYEYQGNIDDTDVVAPPMPPAGIELEMLDEADQSLELRRIGREFRYDAGGFQGVSLRRVAVDRAGLYRITASAPTEAGAFAISVGRGDTPSSSSTDQAAWLVGIIGGAIGVIGLITTGVLRSRARARAAGVLPGQPPAGGPDPSPAPVLAVPVAAAATEARAADAPPSLEPVPAAAAPLAGEAEGVRPLGTEPSDFGAPTEPSTFSATAPLAPVDRASDATDGRPEPSDGADEGSGSTPTAPPPPPPPPPVAAPAPPAGGASAAPSWGPPTTGTASDPFEVRDVPPPPPPPPPES